MSSKRISIFFLCLWVQVVYSAEVPSRRVLFNCIDRFVPEFPVGAIQPRRSIIKLAEEYAHNHSYYSTLRGTELIALSDVESYKNAQAIYLGSGPDIWRPLFEFPDATHIHLVDTLMKWGDSPQELIDEVLKRLQFIGESKVIQSGFLQVMTESERSVDRYSRSPESRSDFLAEYYSRKGSQVPLIIEVNLKFDTTTGRQKFFYLHPRDIADTFQMFDLLDEVARLGPLTSVLQAGLSGTPTAECLQRILKELSPTRGFFIYEDIIDISEDALASIPSIKEFIGMNVEVLVSELDSESKKAHAEKDRLGLNRSPVVYLVRFINSQHE